MFIEDVCDAERDLTGYKEQFENWSKGAENYPIFFLDMSRYNEVKESLMDFLELSKEQRAAFTFELDTERYKKHDSAMKVYETEESEIFDKVYEDLYKEMTKKHGTIVEPRGPKRPFSNDKIRIGYFSPDYNQNAVSLFLTPQFKKYNKDLFEVYIFSNTKFEDQYSQILKSYIYIC